MKNEKDNSCFLHTLTLVPVCSTKEKTTKDDIVVEMKSNTKNEEAVLLKAVNGDKKGPNEQVSWGVCVCGGVVALLVHQTLKRKDLKPVEFTADMHTSLFFRSRS